MSEVDDRVEQECIDCGTVFLALGEWQTRCRRCEAIHKAGAAPSDLAFYLLGGKGLC